MGSSFSLTSFIFWKCFKRSFPKRHRAQVEIKELKIIKFWKVILLLRQFMIWYETSKPNNASNIRVDAIVLFNVILLFRNIYLIIKYYGHPKFKIAWACWAPVCKVLRATSSSGQLRRDRTVPSPGLMGLAGVWAWGPGINGDLVNAWRSCASASTSVRGGD